MTLSTHDGGAGTRGVDPLRLRYGRYAEGCVACDAISVSVGSDHSRGRPPCRRSANVTGWHAERFRPGCLVRETAVEDGIGTSFEERFSLFQCRAHLGVIHTTRLWDESGDQSWRLPCPARSIRGTGAYKLAEIIRTASFITVRSRMNAPRTDHHTASTAGAIIGRAP